jgi:hypothetical protein
MKREEILNMSAGEELDTLIAEKVMELDLSKRCDGNPDYFDTDRWACGKCGAVGRVWDDMEHTIEPKEYSDGIAAAWEVIDKMRKSFWIASLVADTNLWRVTFYTHTHRKTHEAIDESAPLAICRAALLTVMDALP